MIGAGLMAAKGPLVQEQIVPVSSEVSVVKRRSALGVTAH